MAPFCCTPPDGMSSAFCGDVQQMQSIAAIDVHGHFGQLNAVPFATTPPEYLGYTGGRAAMVDGQLEVAEAPFNDEW